MNIAYEVTMDAWKLLETGQPRKAIEAFTRKLRREPTDINYSSRAEAYIQLKEYDNALADLHCANAVAVWTSTEYFERIGVVNWLARREFLAAATWLELVLAIERGKIEYTDAAGGVEPGCLLWFAAVSLGYEELLVAARRLLEAKVARGEGRNWTIENWPGPLAMFLLGSMDEAEVRERISDSDVPILRERELCQTEFYVAVRALEQGDTNKATKDFRKAAALHDGSIENEYDLAQRESRRRDHGRTKRCT
jgi:tetratricopeptide (TPR) repeat protein